MTVISHLASTSRRAESKGGVLQVSGRVTKLGVPGPYRVRLFHRLTGQLITETLSDESGNYLFSSLADDLYLAVAFDHGAEPVNAAISDFVVPERPVLGYQLNLAPSTAFADPSDLTTWTLTQASAALDEIGIFGIANTATTVTDASTTAQGRAVSADTASIAPGSHCWRMWIKQDPAATGYIPELQAVVDGAFQASVQVDIANGLVSGGEIRDGDTCGYPGWWIVAVGYVTTGTAPLAARVFASGRLTLGGAPDNTAVGSPVVGWVDILEGTTPTQALEIVPYY